MFLWRKLKNIQSNTLASFNTVSSLYKLMLKSEHFSKFIVTKKAKSHHQNFPFKFRQSQSGSKCKYSGVVSLRVVFILPNFKTSFSSAFGGQIFTVG